MFESSIDGILLTSPDGRIYSANPAACRILQMTEEEVIQAGRDGIVDLSDTRPQPALEERRQKHRARVELLFKRKDGTTFPTDVSSSVITDKEEHARSAVVFRDISERKEAEEKVRRLNAELEQKVDERTRTLVQTLDRLEKQREVLQTVFDNIPVMLAFYDSTGKMGLLNKELERVLGWCQCRFKMSPFCRNKMSPDCRFHSERFSGPGCSSSPFGEGPNMPAFRFSLSL